MTVLLGQRLLKFTVADLQCWKKDFHNHTVDNNRNMNVQIPNQPPTWPPQWGSCLSPWTLSACPPPPAPRPTLSAKKRKKKRNSSPPLVFEKLFHTFRTMHPTLPLKAQKVSNMHNMHSCWSRIYLPACHCHGWSDRRTHTDSSRCICLL